MEHRFFSAQVLLCIVPNLPWGGAPGGSESLNSEFDNIRRGVGQVAHGLSFPVLEPYSVSSRRPSRSDAINR